jgi:integrase
MEKKFHFTQARIRDLAVPDKGRVDYFDTKEPNLTCRVSSTGHKSYVVLKWNGKTMKRVTIGKYPESVTEARLTARDKVTDINNGIDPTAEKRKKDAEKTTLSECLEQYLSSRSLKPNTIKDYRYKVNHDLAEWANMPIVKITESMVMKKQKQLTQTGTTVANASMRVLRAVMNYAFAVGMIEASPVGVLSRARVWHKNKRRSRIILAEQLQAWHEAVEALPNQKAKVYFLMLLYMGFRSSEALTLEWSNVNMKDKTMTALDTKNHSDHTLPIPKALLPHIKGLHEHTGKHKWVFTGEDTDKHMTVPKKQIATIVKATGIEFSSHDLRRTFATIGEAVGVPLSMIKRMMNHVTTEDITASYISTETDTLRENINKIGAFIHAKATQKDNIIQFTSKKG